MKETDLDKASATYCIVRALEQLRNLLYRGADFKRTRWLFDWDNEIEVKENLERLRGQNSALVTLANSGVITFDSIVRQGLSKEEDYDLHHNLRNYALNENLGAWTPIRFDIAGKASKVVRPTWITSFNYEKFEDQCKVHGLPLVRNVANNSEASTKPIPTTLPNEEFARLEDNKPVGYATISYEDFMTWVSLPTEEKPLPLRAELIIPNSGYDIYLNYLFNKKHIGNNINHLDIQKLPECEKYYDIGNIARYCGFNGVLKKIFFPTRTATDIRIMPNQLVNRQQIELIKQSLQTVS